MNLAFFNYRAFDSQGKIKTGQVNAESKREAIRLLKGKNLTPIRITEAKKISKDARLKKISSNELLGFTNGLCTLVEARVPIDRALRLLDGITESPTMKVLVLNLLSSVKEGKSLANSMEAHPTVFSKMYVNIIRAGEEGGILHELLPELAEFLEVSNKNRQAIVSAMIYPIVLLVTGIISVFLLLIFVVPQFSTMFEDSGSEIPSSALLLLNVSGFIQSYGLFMLLGVALAFIFWQRLDKDDRSKMRKDKFLLSLPLIGPLILYKESAIFSRTLGSLLGSGIPLIRGLRVSKEVILNSFLVRHLDQVEEDVRGGAGLGLSLEKADVFPILLHQLVAVGEESGRTSSILLKTADTFDNLVRTQMSAIVSALQPALIIFLAIAVGGITITMLSAVFSMNAVEF